MYMYFEKEFLLLAVSLASTKYMYEDYDWEKQMLYFLDNFQG